MSFLDVMAVLIIILSVVTAFAKGLVVELLSLASLIAGFVLAGLFYSEAASLLQRWGVPLPWTGLVAFIAIFVSVMAAGFAVVALIDRAVRELHLKWMDRLLGALFGLLRGWLVVSIIFLALAALSARKEMIAQSRTAGFFLNTARLAIILTPEELRQKFYAGYQKVYQLWKERTT